MNEDRKLVDLSVREFVVAVGSADHPCRRGSVAALTGASSAALLALVCEVLERKTPGALSAPLVTARALERRLLDLVDEDAFAFRAFLAAERGSSARHTASANVAGIPLEIGRTCLAVHVLVNTVEPHVRGAMYLDVGAAKQLSAAAARAALDIAEYNLRLGC